MSVSELSVELKGILDKGGVRLFETLLASTDAHRNAAKALEAFARASAKARGESFDAFHVPESLEGMDTPTIPAHDVSYLRLARRLLYGTIGLAVTTAGYAVVTPGPNPQATNTAWGSLFGLLAFIPAIASWHNIQKSKVAIAAYENAKSALGTAAQADERARDNRNPVLAVPVLRERWSLLHHRGA